MTPRTSVRAEARERYWELKREKAVAEQATPSLTLPLSGGGDTCAVQGGTPASVDLTARIRALYETSSVPVREIAQIAGVTERTLYKYVARGNWKRRYVCLPRDEAVARANRGRRWQHADGFAPAKGSGGRFIRRDDIGKPFATGLKALDSQGRARALAACDDVEPRARQAQREAEAAARQEERSRALKAVARAAKGLTDYRAQYAEYRAAKRRAAEWVGDPWRRPELPPFTPNETYERVLIRSLAAAGDWLEALQREEREASSSPSP